MPGLHEGFVRVAHDPGDPLETSHCPFCGSGQVVGLSNGGIQCDFCGQAYLVRVQPAFPGMPQQPGPGMAPTDMGPDMPMGPEELGPDGEPMDGGEDGEPFPPDELGEDGEEGPPGEEEDEEEGGDEGPPPPPPKGKKKSSLQRYATIAGDQLSEEAYIRHLAILHSGGSPGILGLVRTEAAKIRRCKYDRGERQPCGELVTQDGSGEWRHENSDLDSDHEAQPWWSSPEAAVRRQAGLREDTSENRRHYQRGWRTSQRPGEDALSNADLRGEHPAWYDGYMDYAVGRPKWHSLTCPAVNHSEDSNCTEMQ